MNRIGCGGTASAAIDTSRYHWDLSSSDGGRVHRAICFERIHAARNAAGAEACSRCRLTTRQRRHACRFRWRMVCVRLSEHRKFIPGEWVLTRHSRRVHKAQILLLSGWQQPPRHIPVGPVPSRSNPRRHLPFQRQGFCGPSEIPQLEPPIAAAICSPMTSAIGCGCAA
jgi:hypothetical protein